MEMKLIRTSCQCHNMAQLEKRGIKNVEVFTHNVRGDRSHQMTIQFESESEEALEDDAYLAWSLNKNEALYLMNFLKSFVNEKDIDTDAED